MVAIQDIIRIYWQLNQGENDDEDSVSIADFGTDNIYSERGVGKLAELKAEYTEFGYNPVYTLPWNDEYTKGGIEVWVKS